FYEEMQGIPDAEVKKQRRDFDKFDDYCDHLLVIDYDLPKSEDRVVGTYRLLRRSRLGNLDGFYSESEFDISAIKKESGEILELGRSCVDAAHRSRSLMNLLWRGIAEYVSLYDIKLMFGCGSFFGTDINEHKLALSYLYHYHLAPEELRAVALSEHYVEMNLMKKEEINVKEAFNAVPTLIKGYLRLGGYIGRGAVIDHNFNTVDVGIIVKTDLVTEKYAERYARPRGI
ncbi:MAG: GNAT family N-acyltransferase, partial [Pseudomonadota bacterium]